MSRENDPRAKRRALVKRSKGAQVTGIVAGSLATMLSAIALMIGQWWLVLPALTFGIIAGVLFAWRSSEESTPSKPAPPNAHIGMGATVASDAVLEPGAVVEMGATVGSGATIRAGATVRMGATVMSNAVIESGAVVSWGATVHTGAVVGSHAVVGAGSDVMAGAHLPAHTSLMPGSTYLGPAKPTLEPAPPAEKPQAEKPVDPRQARIDSICDRLEAELRQSPESVRSFLGTSTDTIAGLRRTGHDLLRRERALRDESSAEALARLDAEKSVLESRIASTPDDVVRRSLQGAVAAIAEQKRQRELLQRNADRLDAELTRLTYMLEGMTAQLVRLRSAAPAPGAAADPELEKSLGQLHHEIEAIADALEHVSSEADDHLPQPISEISPGSSDGALAHADRPRQRDR